MSLSEKKAPELLKLPYPDRIVAYMPAIDPKDLENLTKQNLWEKLFLNYRLKPQQFGVFQYTYQLSDEFKGAAHKCPYQREKMPTKPITVDDLPLGVRKLVKKLKLKYSQYSTDDKINPRIYDECHEWE
jgi:hypothetical protein